MKAILLIALGGAFGALSRAGLVEWLDWLTPKSNFPWAILTVNLLGCLAIGLIFGAAENRDWLSEATRMMILIGFLGSFTTFSTFGWNTFELFRNGQAVLAFANVALNVMGGLAAVWAGWAMTR